jgi:hypothetical protein
MAVSVDNEIGQQARENGLEGKQKSQAGRGFLFSIGHCGSSKASCHLDPRELIRNVKAEMKLLKYARLVIISVGAPLASRSGRLPIVRNEASSSRLLVVTTESTKNFNYSDHVI